MKNSRSSWTGCKTGNRCQFFTVHAATDWCLHMKMPMNLFWVGHTSAMAQQFHWIKLAPFLLGRSPVFLPPSFIEIHQVFVEQSCKQTNQQMGGNKLLVEVIETKLMRQTREDEHGRKNRHRQKPALGWALWVFSQAQVPPDNAEGWGSIFIYSQRRGRWSRSVLIALWWWAAV